MQVFYYVSYLRWQRHVQKTAGVPLKSRDVQQGSVSFWIAVDAVKFVLGSSLKTAVRHSHVTAQRDWNATLEVDLIFLRASVEVQWVFFCCLLFLSPHSLYISHFKPYCFSCFPKKAKLDGRTCEYNNKIYQNGETFRPNCKHQCTCMDGGVGCVSLCPHELLLTRLDCAKPRRVKVQGQCCEQLICPEEAKSKSSAVKKHSKDRASEDNRSKNEFFPVWRGKAKSLSGEQFYTMTILMKQKKHIKLQM